MTVIVLLKQEINIFGSEELLENFCLTNVKVDGTFCLHGFLFEISYKKLHNKPKLLCLLTPTFVTNSPSPRPTNTQTSESAWVGNLAKKFPKNVPTMSAS